MKCLTAIVLLTASLAWGAYLPPLSPPEKVKAHWAFKPVKQPPLPSVKSTAWAQSSVDRFVLARLEARGWTPSPLADRRTLIRRAYWDLTGLAPTPAEVEKFIKDKSPDAWPKLIDRLLASPHYGERWARHWLDVARYADNKGYVGVGVDRRYPYSYTYRDYVVRAFNEDLPFNRFIIEQIAADHLKLGDDQRPLAALGYLTLGRRFLNREDDIIDDRIDVVTRGFMALTVTCARCHDHKYDPIPTADYYSLHGVFASSHEPKNLPLLGNASLLPEHGEFLKAKKKIEDKISELRRVTLTKGMAQLRRRAGEYLLAIHDVRQLSLKQADQLVTQRKLNRIACLNWRASLAKWKREKHPVFRAWFGEKGGNAKVNERLKNAKTPAEQAKAYGDLFQATEKRWTDLTKKNEKATALPDADWEAIRQVLHAKDTPAQVPASLPENNRDSLLFGQRNKLRTLRTSIGGLAATHPGSPPRAQALLDKPKPIEPYIFLRGKKHNRGPKVPRQFLGHLSPNRKPFTQGSGRLELAKSIANPGNPLTARVLVNRVWTHHFGRGLVATPSDFGLRAQPPTHPRLLDWLAARFVAEGWSIKKLHRHIMLSATYQQAANDRAEYAQADPDNTLIWKMNRQRLTFEALRDGILQASGDLDLKTGGRPVDITKHPTTPRRTLYGFIDRQNLPSVFRTFDFASPDAHCPHRFENTVPQQALYLMNSPFIVGQSRKLVRRAGFVEAKNDRGRVLFLYQTILQRAPTGDELQDARKYIAAVPERERGNAWAELVQVLLISNEFRFVD